jgi:RNA polymerase sigma factor (TIGR02999 family)
VTDSRPDSAPGPSHLLPAVYDELRRQARSYLLRERASHTLQATALVHEAYLRLADQRVGEWANEAHFCAVAASAMRRVLVDHARGHRAAKRGGGALRVTLCEEGASDAPHGREEREIDVLDLDAALSELAALDPRQARVVELRTFGGLTLEEAAEALGVARSTAAEDWRMARAFLSWKLSER